MNKVYKCVWNAALGVWSVASELASAKKKTKSCLSLSHQGENSKSAIQNILLITAVASIGAMSSSAYAAPIHAEDTAVSGNLYVQNLEFWKLLTNGHYDAQVNEDYYTTGGRFILEMHQRQMVVVWRLVQTRPHFMPMASLGRRRSGRQPIVRGAVPQLVRLQQQGVQLSQSVETLWQAKILWPLGVDQQRQRN